jgi:type IV secretion system protein VirB10
VRRWIKAGRQEGAAGEADPQPDPQQDGADAVQEFTEGPDARSDNRVAGERRIPSVNRVRSLQSRVSAALTIGLVSSIGLGLLFWYYSQALTRGERAQQAAERATQQRAQGEMALPPLGDIERPRVVPADTAPEPPLPERVLGPPPPLPAMPRSAARVPNRPSGVAPAKSAEAQALARRLTGSVLITESGSSANTERDPRERSVAAGNFETSNSHRGSVAAASSGELGSMLTSTVVQPTRAHTLPSRHLVMPKGTSIDCTLETAIDSSLPGLVTCITATDTFSADGEVVLLDRGTKLIGETRGQVKAGMARVFVLWNEARTPAGVIAPLESPGTDELGRAGLSGEVDRHFWERFGAALLISVVDGAIQAAAQSGSNGTVVVNPSTSSQILTEVLRNTINIPPTVLKHQGDRVQVVVARDIDFGSVYELRGRQH